MQTQMSIGMGMQCLGDVCSANRGGLGGGEISFENNCPPRMETEIGSMFLIPPIFIKLTIDIGIVKRVLFLVCAPSHHTF